MTLTARLRPPAPPAAPVGRAHLLPPPEALPPLTLLTAPAGYGKTSLVAEWLAAQPASALLPAAWLTLAADANDPMRLLNDLGAALARPWPSPPPGADWRAAAAAWLAAVEQGPAHPRVLIVDEAHTLTTEAALDVLAFIAEHLPVSLRLIVLSRGVPAWPLARWQLAGRLRHLTAEHLRFSPLEARTLLTQLWTPALPAAAMSVLIARAEGWAAGLTLAAHALRAQPDPLAFVAALSGVTPPIGDYLWREVWAQQPAAWRRFMRNTVILNALSGPVCEAVLDPAPEAPAAAEQLRTLARAGLFLSPADSQGEWFRYHPWFADFLRRQVALEAPARVAVWHQRAAEWWEAHGHPEAAIDHAVAAGDGVRAARLIDHQAAAWMRRGEAATILARLAQVPEAVRAARPSLALWQGWALAFAGDLAGAARWAALAEAVAATHGLAPDQQRLTAGQAAAIQVFVARQQGRAAEAQALADRALELLGDRDATLSGAVWLALGLTHTAQGRLGQAQTALQRAGDLGHQARHPYIEGHGRLAAALALQLEGRLAVAQARLAEAQALATQHGLTSLAGQAEVALAEGHYERDECAQAEALVQHGLAQIAPGDNPHLVFWGGRLLALLRAVEGDWPAAWGALRQAALAAPRAIQPRVDAWRARLHAWQGDLNQAEQWAAEAEAASGESGHWPRQWRDELHLNLCRVDCLRPAPEAWARAEARLRALREAAEADGPFQTRLEVWLVLALLHRARGQSAAAVRAVEQALALGGPLGYWRRFLDEGPRLTSLLARVRHSHPQRALAQALWLASSPGAAAPGQAEPLNPHELAILRLLAAGRANPEIARERVLAVSTVRWYVKHIYRKLGVHNRIMAVERARALNLL